MKKDPKGSFFVLSMAANFAILFLIVQRHKGAVSHSQKKGVINMAELGLSILFVISMIILIKEVKK